VHEGGYYAEPPNLKFELGSIGAFTTPPSYVMIPFGRKSLPTSPKHESSQAYDGAAIFSKLEGTSKNP
jgi:hypothetical protein